MAVDGSTLILGVGDLVHPRHGILIRLRDEVDLIAWLIGQVTDHMAVLGGKVLMDEEVLHSSSAAISAARSASSFAGLGPAPPAISSCRLRGRSSTSRKGGC